ncbi:MAG: radical SAM protein [Deltaproteobacteria bacterium]|nr:radical SAM protein [Deltaproteobacteria bacterium]
MNTTTTEKLAQRRVDDRGWRPRNCVWELTLACNLRCEHCGSRAGRARPEELGTDECLSIVSQLADLGCELVTLSGGEPTLRKDWDVIARAVAGRGIYVNVVTNGVYRSDEAAREIAARARDAGLANVGVSLDGPEDVHDRLRGPGTFARTIAAIGHFRAAGLPVAVLTTVNRRNLVLLPEVRRIVMEAGAGQWRLQLAKPMGTMDEHRDIVIRPEQLLTLIPMLARLKKAGGVHLHVGDSIGYYGPHDKVLRGVGWRGRKECWKGCQAGMQAIGIEADGGVKGCLSLQAKWGDRDPFVEGNLKERTLADVWYDPRSFSFNRDFTEDALTGVCAGCPKGGLCRGGARCVSSAVSGLLTEDPYCYYRLAGEAERPISLGLGRAAVAAATLALSLGAAGCASSRSNGGGGDEDAATAEDSGQVGEDGSVNADYGVDPEPDSGVDASAQPEYGIKPGPDAGEDASVQAEYGIKPQLDAGDECANVCCECDYGDPPPPECCQ